MKRKKKQQPNNVGEHIEVEKNDVKRELTGHRSCVLDNQDIWDDDRAYTYIRACICAVATSGEHSRRANV